jgi:hypothetical protein
MVTITKEDLECPEWLKQHLGETREQYRQRLESYCKFPGDEANVQLFVMDIEEEEDERLHFKIKTYITASRKKMNKRKKQRRATTGRR